MEYVKIDCPVCGGKKSACLQTESRIFRCHLCGADGELQVRPGSEGMRFKPDGKPENKEEWLKRQPWFKPKVNEQVLKVATELTHAYLIATAINPDWKVYDPDGKVDPSPGCCVNIAKKLIEKAN